MPNIDEIFRETVSGFKPPEKQTLSEWADANAYLSAESSAEAGRWKTIPYQRGILDALTDPSIEQITVMKSARVGFTKCLNHIIAYHIAQDPCSIMMVQPTIEDAEGYSKEELAPMLRDTPSLAGIVQDAKTRDGTNTILSKLYPGGTLSLVGANSPRGFRRVSRRIVLFDEVDGYPASAGTEGDPIKLGIKRTEYYWNRKIVAGSTPTNKDSSRIEKLFGQTDQRRYFVPCPHCGYMQYLKWPQIKWPPDEPEKAYYECESCKEAIEHKHKRWMIENGEWQPTAKGNGKHVGFHIWAAYSYSPNATWANIACEFIESKGNSETLKTFINTTLGELWEEEYTAKVGADALEARAEFYDPFKVPLGACILVAGVDVQDNRLAIEVTAYGAQEESWTMSYQEIFGDPAQPAIWKQLDDLLLRDWPHESGKTMPLSAMAVDSGGHYTAEVYQYARERRIKNVIAVKGASQRAKPPISKPSKVDINFRGQSLKGGAEVYIVGTDTIKTTLYSRMKMEEPGHGFIHFNTSLGAEYYSMLAAEKKQIKYIKGFPVTEWVKANGVRNEALDCKVYGYAALQWLYTKYNRATIWQQFEKKLGLNTHEQAKSRTNNKELDSGLQNKPAPKTIKEIVPVPRRGGFATKW
jgi:phage terminase large subunit GpA-like protein